LRHAKVVSGSSITTMISGDEHGSHFGRADEVIE
jgi:hypothetical protein